jgi:hypothetical protein
MSLLAVGALLDGEFEWHEIVDGNVETDPVARIAAIGPGKAMRSHHGDARAAAAARRARFRQLRLAHPGVPIVWGGYFPSQHAEVLARRLCGLLRSRAGRAVIRRADACAGARRLVVGDSRALVVRAGRIRETPAPFVPLDSLPMWHEAVDMPRYFHRHYLGNRVGTHHSSHAAARSPAAFVQSSAR